MWPSEKKTFHLSNILILLPKVDDGSLMSRNARDDKNGRFGERAPRLTQVGKISDFGDIWPISSNYFIHWY